jgi:hypothetical protein
VTDLDPQIRMVLDRLVLIPVEAGDWGRVVADSGATKPRDSLLRSRRLALALVALALLAAAFAFVPALAGQGYFWFLDYGAPKPTTPVVTVTSITDRSGTTWQLTAYQSEKQGLCFQLTNEARSGAAVCGSATRVGVGIFGADSGTFVLGPVTADARRVDIVGSAGEVEAMLATAPEELGSDIKFYVTQLPVGFGAPRMVRALDEQGQVIASRSIPSDTR